VDCVPPAEEVSLGSLTPIQYRTACSAWSQSIARFGALFNGRFRATCRFYQLCAELAYKKQQLSTLGDEGGNAKIIEKLRSELARLSTQVYLERIGWVQISQQLSSTGYYTNNYHRESKGAGPAVFDYRSDRLTSHLVNALLKALLQL